MSSKNSSKMCARTTSPLRVESMSKIGSFEEFMAVQPLYPRQELRSFVISRSSSNGDNNYDSSSSSSSSSCGSDSYDDDSDQVRINELSASGSFAESVRCKSATRTIYPQACLIPSLSSAPDELLDTKPLASPPSSLSYQLRRQLLSKQESNFNSSYGEPHIIDNSTGWHQSTSSPIQNINSEGDLIQHDTEEASSTNEWLQSSTDYYSHTLLPVVLEGDEGGAITSSPDLRQHKHKECETEVEEKIETKTKSSNLCGSMNDESLDTILTAHKFLHNDNERISDNHHDDNNIKNLKVDPATDTIPVVLEGDEGGAITSSPDLRQHNHKECETEVKEKIETKTKSSNLCGSMNGESLDTILTAHKFFHDDNECISDNHHDDNNIENLKVDPATDTIGSDTCQTQSLSNHSSSSFSNTHLISPCPSATTHQQNLEEELDSRLQVILALKDAVVMQNRKSKKAARLSRRTNSKLISCTKANLKLTKRNLKLEEEMENMQKEFREMRQRMVEAEIELMTERWKRMAGESAGMPMKEILQESSECDIYHHSDSYDDENHELASF